MKQVFSELSNKTKCKKLIDQEDDWFAWLAEGDDPKELAVLRRNIDKGLPCGTGQFISKLEKIFCRTLQFRTQGRPKQDNEKG